MSEIELLEAQVRMEAMHAAISYYCCQRGGGGGSGDPLGNLEETLPLLMRIRNRLLETALTSGPI